MFLNPGDEERYSSKINTTIEKFINEGKLTVKEGVLSFEVTDKCLKS